MRISLAVQNTEQVVMQVHRNQLDLGLVEASVNGEGLGQQVLARDELIVVLPARHPLAGQDYLSLEQFLHQPLVLRKPSSGTRDVLEEALLQYGVDPATSNKKLAGQSFVSNSIRGWDGPVD